MKKIFTKIANITENAVKSTKEFFSKPKKQEEDQPELTEIQQYLVR